MRDVARKREMRKKREAERERGCMCMRMSMCPGRADLQTVCALRPVEWKGKQGVSVGQVNRPAAQRQQ